MEPKLPESQASVLPLRVGVDGGIRTDTGQRWWVQIPTPPLTAQVILVKLLIFPELHFPHLYNGNTKSSL